MLKTEEIFYSKNRPGEFLSYYKFTPEQKGKLPLIIDVHGAGSRGSSLSAMPTDTGLLGQLLNGRELDAAVVMPQCRYDTWFEVFDVLLEFIDSIRNDPAIDIDRVYLMGASMGGYTVWQLAMSRPDWFAAIVPICGGGMYWNAARLKKLPIWAFHGALDKTVLPEESIHMVASVNNSGGNARLTIFPKAEHNAWDPACETEELFTWLFKQKRTSTK